MNGPRMAIAITLTIVVASTVDAGIFSKKRAQPEEVPGGRPPQLVTTNGVVVPPWASRRIAESPVPLFGKSWGRRPWVLPLSSQATPSAVMARANQLGFGPGSIPGYTNGPNGPAANYPMAQVGPVDPNFNGWAPNSGLRNLFSSKNSPYLPGAYPFVTGITGY